MWGDEGCVRKDEVTGRTPRQTPTTTGKTALPYSRDFVITERPFTRLWLSKSPLHREKITVRKNAGNLKILQKTQGICQICFVFVIVTYPVDRHREN